MAKKQKEKEKKELKMQRQLTKSNMLVQSDQDLHVMHHVESKNTLKQSVATDDDKSPLPTASKVTPNELVQNKSIKQLHHRGPDNSHQ